MHSSLWLQNTLCWQTSTVYAHVSNTNNIFYQKVEEVNEEEFNLKKRKSAFNTAMMLVDK